ncbi:unnamed protein product [Cuscuta europaea]|uniref:Glycosyltransferase n=1 Tax=Cuscuta europaea TaxID=41803 RepID=A0A9P0YQ17_CUSEU|nr:unnamed protein product [Cuscuta europaea]
MVSRKEYVVVFPFMAEGHIIPFLALALKLEQERNFAISFVNTPRNINKLRSSLPPHSAIRLLEIPFNGEEHGLPPGAESTESLPIHLHFRLIQSSPSLKPAFRELLSELVCESNGIPPMCVISDIFFPWSADVAHEFGSSHAIFNAGCGYGMAVYHTAWLNLPHLNAKSEECPLPGFPNGTTFCVTKFPERLRQTKEPSEFALTLFREWSKTDAMLFNTIEEIDQTGMKYFRDNFPFPAFPIGPIFSYQQTSATLVADSMVCMDWLDKKPPKSVLYIAFGSQSTPSIAQMKALASALEASEVNFLWVARRPSSFAALSPENDQEWLPRGFEERIKRSGKGMLVKKWAPQKEILAHGSVGAFLSHCGWNSTMEALANGLPILSWAMSAEQPFNAKMLEEELKVCVEVANGSDSQVNSEQIVGKIKMVMEGKEGEEMRKRASEIMKKIKNATCDDNATARGSSVKALDEFCVFASQKRNMYLYCPNKIDDKKCRPELEASVVLV